MSYYWVKTLVLRPKVLLSSNFLIIIATVSRLLLKFIGIALFSSLSIVTLQAASAQANTNDFSNQTGTNSLPAQLIPPEITGAIIGGILGIVGGLISGWVLGIRKEQSDARLQLAQHKAKLEEEYDITLRVRRIDAYKVLWSCLYPFRLHCAPRNFYCIDLKYAVSRLTEWYYSEGGIFLTEANQKTYQSFVEKLEDVLKEGELENKRPADSVDYGKLNEIKDAASAFRTSLCKDIGTRDEPKIRSLYGDLEIAIQPEELFVERSVTFVVKYNGRDFYSGLGYLRDPFRNSTIFLDIRNLNDYSIHEVKEQSKPISNEARITWTPKNAGNYIARVIWDVASAVKTLEVKEKEITPKVDRDQMPQS